MDESLWPPGRWAARSGLLLGGVVQHGAMHPDLMRRGAIESRNMPQTYAWRSTSSEIGDVAASQCLSPPFLCMHAWARHMLIQAYQPW